MRIVPRFFRSTQGPSSKPDPGGQIVSAHGRPRCTVAIDIRHARLGAVAVDSRGEVQAWGWRDGAPSDPGGRLENVTEGASQEAELEAEGSFELPDASEISELVSSLKVRIHELRVLLGPRHMQVAALSAPITLERVEQALLGEGFSAMNSPAFGAQPAGPEASLIARGRQDLLAGLAESMARQFAVEPRFAADALLLVPDGEGAVNAEYDGRHLTLVAQCPGSEPVSRTLVTPWVEEAAAELLRTCQTYSLEGPILFLGSHGERLGESFGEESRDQGLSIAIETKASELAGLELARRLASGVKFPAFDSALLSVRQEAERWAGRLGRASVVLGLCGLILSLIGMVGWWQGRAQDIELRGERERVDSQLAYLRESAALAEEIKQLRSEQALNSLLEPPIARTLAVLEQASPRAVGWQKIKVEEGILELEVSALRGEAQGNLETLRQSLEDSSGLSNPAWDPPVADESGAIRQILRASLIEPWTPGGS